MPWKSSAVTAQITKRRRCHGFSGGQHRVHGEKADIAGFGMNWQHANVAFVGLSHSYEQQFYQAVRRSWRFGQKNEVNVYIITSTAEGNGSSEH